MNVGLPTLVGKDAHYVRCMISGSSLAAVGWCLEHWCSGRRAPIKMRVSAVVPVFPRGESGLRKLDWRSPPEIYSLVPFPCLRSSIELLRDCRAVRTLTALIWQDMTAVNGGCWWRGIHSIMESTIVCVRRCGDVVVRAGAAHEVANVPPIYSYTSSLTDLHEYSLVLGEIRTLSKRRGTLLPSQ